MDVTDDRTEQLVRETLNAVANQVQSPEGESKDAHPQDRSSTSRATVAALRRTHRRKRRLVIIAACVVILLVAGGVALVTTQAEKSPKVSVGQAAVEPPVADAPPYGIPATDAEITSLVPMSSFFEQSYEGTYAGASAQVTVSIQVVPDVLQKGVESLAGCLADFPKVQVNGHEGCTFSVVAQGTKEVVSWVEDSNSVIGLQSTTLSRDQLVELANAARRDGSRVALDPVPDGLQPSGTHIDPNADHPGYVYVNFSHNDCDYFLTRELSTTLPTGLAATINGYPGALTPENTVAWVVRGALMTLRVGSIQGPGDPVQIHPAGPQPIAPTCDLQATAATIRYITEAEWKQLVGDHAPDTADSAPISDAPPTTTTAGEPDIATVQLSPERQVDWLTRQHESESSVHLPGWRTELSAERVACDFAGVPGMSVQAIGGSASDFPLGDAITADRIIQECANGTDATRSAGIDLTSQGTLCRSVSTQRVAGPAGGAQPTDVLVTEPAVIFSGGSCEASGYETPAPDFIDTVEQQRRTEILLRAVPRVCPTADEARTWVARQVTTLPEQWTVSISPTTGCALPVVDWWTHTVFAP